MKKEHSLWVEKFRPSKLSDYVFRDKSFRSMMEQWIKEKDIPHLLFSGPAGTGKTSAINVLINEIGIDSGDTLYINASEETSIEVIRNKVINFISTVPNGDFKVCLLEEAEQMSPNAQSALKRIMEDYAHSARFILTSNNVNKIIPPIRSRCQEVVLNRLDEESFLGKLIEILSTEGVEIDEDAVVVITKACYPDLRKAINTCQRNTIDGKLISSVEDNSSTSDYMVQVVALFQEGRLTEARKLISSQIRPEEVDEFFRLLYRNLEWWGDTEEKQEEAIVIIRNGLVKSTLVADQEINISATIVELDQLRRR